MPTNEKHPIFLKFEFPKAVSNGVFFELDRAHHEDAFVVTRVNGNHECRMPNKIGLDKAQSFRTLQQLGKHESVFMKLDTPFQ